MKLIAKDKLREGAVDLMLSNEEKILANSRLAVCNSYYIPVIIGTMIMSSVYLTSPWPLDHLFGIVFVALSFYSFFKRKKECKTIMELKE